MDWTPAFAGETNLRHGSFSSFRRKPESSSIKHEIRCPHNYDLISNVGEIEASCFLKKNTLNPNIVIYFELGERKRNFVYLYKILKEDL